VAAAVPKIEPLSFRAGETVKWEKTLANYPAGEGWALTYYLVGPNQKLTITTAASGDAFAVTISAATTETLSAGDHYLEGRASKAGEVFSVFSGSVKVLPNFADDGAIAAGYDGRSFARRVRDALRAMVEGTAEFPEIAYTIFGERNVQLVPLKDRMDALALFESKVAEEEKAERANRGERTGVYIRFRSPR
jgi:hypothetical protein